MEKAYDREFEDTVKAARVASTTTNEAKGLQNSKHVERHGRDDDDRLA
jgi:hypothetical protein